MNFEDLNRIRSELSTRSSRAGSGQISVGQEAASWTLWAAPAAGRKALLVTSRCNLTAAYLLGMYRQVDVWIDNEAAAHKLRDVYSVVGPGLAIQYEAADNVIQRLEYIDNEYALVVLEDILSSLPNASRQTKKNLFRRLGRLVAESFDSQVIVVDRNRFSLANLQLSARKLRPLNASSSQPTPAQVSALLRTAGAHDVQTVLFHPNHYQPHEILGWRGSLPLGRNDFLSKALDRIGLVKKVIGSFACVTKNRPSASLFDYATDLVTPWALSKDYPQPAECMMRDNGMVMLTLQLGQGKEAILRVALSADASSALAAAVEATDQVSRAYPAVKELIPTCLTKGEYHGLRFHVERKIKGVTGQHLVHDAKKRTLARQEVLGFVLSLHLPSLIHRSGSDAISSAGTLEHLKTISRAESVLSCRLERVAKYVVEQFTNAPIPFVRIHGDLNVGNVLFCPTTTRLCAVVDWDQSLDQSLPFDLVHYLISEKRVQSRKDWGEVIARFANKEMLDADDQALLTQHDDSLRLAHEIFLPFLCAYWLRSVAVRVARSNGVLAERWRLLNLIRPLEAFEGRIT